MGVALAMTISFLKASRDKREQNWGENILCGIFSGIALTGVSVIQSLIVQWLNLPEGTSVPTALIVGIVAGFIAWHGSYGTIDLIRNRGSSKDGSKPTEDSE